MVLARLCSALGLRPGEIRQIHLGTPRAVKIQGEELWIRLDDVANDSAKDIQQLLWRDLGIVAGIGAATQDERGKYWQAFSVIGFDNAKGIAPGPAQ
jgi:hypothetical protein